MALPKMWWRSRFVLAGFFVAASVNVSAACFQVDGMRIPEFEAALSDTGAVIGNDPSQRIAPLESVYQRIAGAAQIRPALWVCNNPEINAEAIGDPNEGLVIIYVPMLELVNNDVDALAFLLAHEFSHLLLNHQLQKRAAFQNIASWAQWVANNQYQRTGRAREAIKQGNNYWSMQSNAFSRALERDADDKGFSLAVTIAKFSSDGGKKFFAKASKLPQSDRPSYLSNHPGVFDRLDRADLQSLNQSYIDAAEDLLGHNKWKNLTSLVDRWLRETPQSGAAWYYDGRSLVHSVKAKTEITQAFENSVSYYLDSKSLGALSQGDQKEVPDAWFNLCTALFDEGYKVESANCSRRITDATMKDKFQEETFQGLLIVGGSEMPAPKDLWIAREASGSKLLTNDKSIAASRGPLHEFPPEWRAVRFPAATSQ